MAAEFTYTQESIEVDEPLLLENTETVSLLVENTGDVAGTSLGFYLRSASTNGSFDYPSVDSPSVNLVDLIKEGNNGYGLVITQGLTSTRFEDGIGDSYDTRIPLVIGTGTLSDEMEVGSSVEIELSLSFDPSISVKNLYIDFVLE